MADILAFPRPSKLPQPAKPLQPEPLWRHLLGDQLRRLRHEHEETLGETAAKAGVSPQYLSEVERGLKEPSSEMIAAIAGALETSLIDLTSTVADELRAASAPASAVVSTGRFALAA
ncbi:helix-turn-helix domain-containing protein [Microbacterium sp.]|uniref:helix-turn-helix domain-containing protein n=1 Tax=Microbacterium sp. TaxID=51671 RepID=UPI003F9BAC03